MSYLFHLQNAFEEKNNQGWISKKIPKGEITSFNITFHPRHTGRKDTAVTQIRSRIGLSRLEAIPRDGTGATEHHDELKKIHRLKRPKSLPVYPPQNRGR